MRYIAAYLLLVLGGKAEPTESDVSKLLSSAGVSVDEARLKTVVAALHGKKLEELIAAGNKKLAMVPSGGGGGGGGAAAAAPAAGGAKKDDKKPEPKKEEKVRVRSLWRRWVGLRLV